MNFKSYISISFILYFSIVNSQTCCSGGIPLSNNIGLPILQKGTIQLGLNYDYNNLNTLNFETNTLDDNSRLRVTHSILASASYAFTDNFSAEGLFTWVNQRRIISQFGNENLSQSSGIGDAVFLLKYNFKNALGKNTDLGLGLGTKIPLGSSTETDDRGILLINDLQPGSNAWDIIYWLSGSKQFNFRPSFSASTRIIYRSTGTDSAYQGNSSYKYGNEFQAFLSFSDQFLFLKTLANPSISFKYRNTIQDKVGGFNLDNTGGDWISIIPNFAINLTPKIVFSVKAELPIYNNVDGTQLTPTYRLTSGILIKISPKEKLLNLN